MALLIEWSDQLSVKIPSIDRQHKMLIRYINELNDAIVEEKGSFVAGHVLRGLATYTSAHFMYEEMMFKSYNYSEIEGHKAAHGKLVDKVIDYKTRFESGDAEIADELLRFLKGWLTNHILKEDMAYSDYLISKGVR